VALAILVALNVGAWAMFPPRAADAMLGQTSEEIGRDARTVINALAHDLNAWRVSHGGRLPATLEGAQLSTSGVTFTRLDDTQFTLSLAIGSVTVGYDSRTVPRVAAPAAAERQQ
jgi:hypothetical protein